MLTDEGDLVVDPFAGSCVTGEVCERLRRRWICVELQEKYLQGALGRFTAPETSKEGTKKTTESRSSKGKNAYFQIPRIGLLWNHRTKDKLPEDGGKKRPTSTSGPRNESPDP